MIDCYGNELHTGDRIVVIEQYNTHRHRLFEGEVDSIGSDGRGDFAFLEITTHDGFTYFKKFYITEKCVYRIESDSVVIDFDAVQQASRYYTESDKDLTVYDRMSFGGKALVNTMAKAWLKAWLTVLDVEIEIV